MSTKMSLEALAGAIGAELQATAAERTQLICGVAPLDRAGPGEISFLTNPKYAARLKDTKASAVILPVAVAGLALPQLIHKNAYAAMARASTLFFARRRSFHGQSETVFVHPTAKIDPTATLFPRPRPRRVFHPDRRTTYPACRHSGAG